MVKRPVSYRVALRCVAMHQKKTKKKQKKVPAFDDASMLLSLPHRLLTRQPESVSVKL
jgi:hypothetical protein